MLTVPTPLDHMYVHATLDTREMENLAGVILKVFLQSQLFKAESNLKLLISNLLTQIMASEVVKHLS